MRLAAGVGGIETEAVMLGLPVSLTLPEVVGCELTGSSNPFVTSIDVVLGITKVRAGAGRTPSSWMSRRVCRCSLTCPLVLLTSGEDGAFTGPFPTFPQRERHREAG